MYKSLNLSTLNTFDVQNYLQNAIVPRPICFASTIDENGLVNLSPFSFFNMVSTDPPILIFSPSRRVRDNTTKHTLENIKKIPEVAINIVSYDMVQQVSLSSCDYKKDQNEFIKAGFTEERSLLIKPPRVRESPVQMECKVNQVIALGEKAGAGNLVIAEVMMMHIHEEILNDKGGIDQNKLDIVARLGSNWYARINKENIFEVEKPNLKLGIGVDQLPESIRNSKILTPNNLGQLANVDALPSIDVSFRDEKLKNIFYYYSAMPDDMENEIHLYASELLKNNKVIEAWQVLLSI